MKSWKRAVTVALCAASLLAGCGGDCGLKDGEDYTVEDLRGINIPLALLERHEVVTVNVHYTDENGEEQTDTYTYTNYRTALYSLDLDSQVCAEVQGLTLPSVEEGWEGSSYVNNFQVMDDGSIWIFCMVNQYKTELPDDFDPNTQDEWQYQVNENKTVMVHLDATGAELARFDLIPPQDETTDGTASADTVVGSASGGNLAKYDMPAGYYSNISSVVVSEDGTIYGYDWQNVYLFDSEGKYPETTAAS